MTTELPIDDERLSAYLDGELSADGQQAFEDLLSREPEYQQAVDELSAMGTWVQALPKYSLGNDFANQVQRRLEVGAKATHATTGANRGRRNLIISGIVALAASLLLMLMVPGVFKDIQVAQQSTSNAPKDGSANGPARAEVAAEPPADASLNDESEAEEMARSRSSRASLEAGAKKLRAEENDAVASLRSESNQAMTESTDDDRLSAGTALKRSDVRVAAPPPASPTAAGETRRMFAPGPSRMPAALRAPNSTGAAPAPTTTLDQVREKLAKLGVKHASVPSQDRLREQKWKYRFGRGAGARRSAVAATPPYPGNGELILVQGSRQQLRDIARQLKELDLGLVIDELSEELPAGAIVESSQPGRLLSEKSAVPTATFLGGASDVGNRHMMRTVETRANDDATNNQRDDQEQADGRAEALASQADKDDLVAGTGLGDDLKERSPDTTALLVFVPTSSPAPATPAAAPE